MTERTTAEILGQYRKELLANDIPEDVADYLVRDAANIMLRNSGYVDVKAADQ